MAKVVQVLVERLFMRKLWGQFRNTIAEAVVPGSGGTALLGDSITHMGRWDLLFPEQKLRNFGISGERSEHLLLRLDPLIALRPEKVFILIGTNDLATRVPAADIERNVEALLQRLKEALPRCRVHLQGVMPRQKKFAASVLALNAAYADIAHRHGATYIDLFPLLDDGSGQLRPELSNDSLHLNGLGYSIWRKALGPYLA